MAHYIVANYTVTNPEGYEAYLPGVLPTLMAHNVEVVVAEHASEALEGDAHTSTVVLKFADKDAALAWYNSEEYQAVIGHRVDNSNGQMVIVPEFTMPG